MQSFLKLSKTTEFPLENFPYGIYHLKSESSDLARCCTRLGDLIIDLSVLITLKLLNLETSKNPFLFSDLNTYISLGKKTWLSVRSQLQTLFENSSPQKKFILENEKKIFQNIENVNLLLPCKVGDYTDFYSSYNHAFNIGTMFRGKQNAIKPNWKWLPVGYHGRSSSIVVSPAEFKRPSGQKKPTEEGKKPSFSKSNKMDFELEMVTVIGKENKLGEPINIKNAWEHIFGYLVMNDVSARDIQAWEYIPLGPFTAKNLLTVVSPWIVTPEALEPFRTKLPKQDPEPHSYLLDPNHSSYDLNLNVFIETEKSKKCQLLSKSNFKFLYWNPAQQLTHHTVTGCNLRVGDFLGSGTISGPTRKESGSFIELSWNGKEDVLLEDGEVRKFWGDGDSITMTSNAQGDGYRIGFGECRVKLNP